MASEQSWSCSWMQLASCLGMVAICCCNIIALPSTVVAFVVRCWLVSCCIVWSPPAKCTT